MAGRGDGPGAGFADAAGVRVELGDWVAFEQAASAVRSTVFVEEQRVPAALEIDAFDPQCVHALARDADGTVLATGRLLPDGHIGRMAVLQRARGRGVGSLVLRALMRAAAQRGHTAAVLSAQVHAVPFYRRHGFVVTSAEPYDDCGIPHVDMRAELDPAHVAAPGG